MSGLKLIIITIIIIVIIIIIIIIITTPDAESRHLAHPKHCPHTESDVLRIEQSELSHF